MSEPLPILILPTWLYHPTEGGKIFRTREEIEEAGAQGWRDSPDAALAAAHPKRHQEGPSLGLAFDIDGPAVEPAPDDGIEKVQVAVAKKHKRKTS